MTAFAKSFFRRFADCGDPANVPPITIVSFLAAAGDRVVREMRIKVNLFLQLLGNGLVQGAGAMLCAT